MSNAHLLYFSEKTEIKLQFFFTIANPFIKEQNYLMNKTILHEKTEPPKGSPIL